MPGATGDTELIGQICSGAACDSFVNDATGFEDRLGWEGKGSQWGSISVGLMSRFFRAWMRHAVGCRMLLKGPVWSPGGHGDLVAHLSQVSTGLLKIILIFSILLYHYKTFLLMLMN